MSVKLPWNKSSDADTAPERETTTDDPTAKKGRPTPSRKEAEARNQRPLVPADRKEAKAQAKAKRDEAFRREQEALATGDERYLPIRDKGPVRRMIRDFVDSRWTLSEFIVPGMLLFLVLMMILPSVMGSNAETGSKVLMAITFVFYGIVILSVIEGVITWQLLKRQIKATYPTETIPKGSWFYCYSRMVMARRWRSPKPQVARGEKPWERNNPR